MNWVSGCYVLGGPEGDTLDAVDRLHAHLRDGLLELLLAFGGLVVLAVFAGIFVVVLVVIAFFVVLVVGTVLVVDVFGFRGGHDMQSLQY